MACNCLNSSEELTAETVVFIGLFRTHADVAATHGVLICTDAVILTRGTQFTLDGCKNIRFHGIQEHF